MNIELLNQMVDEGYINKSKHETLDLFIYNYNQECQFKKVWNEATIMSRGLILDSEYKVYARPFPKFFNWEELEGLNIEVPKEKFTYTPKMDGSLGIIYFNGNEWDVATRGSFASDQAIKAKEMLCELYPEAQLTKGYTYLMEIIYPDNRIVVNYGEEQKLTLLAVIDNETGNDDFQEFNVAEFWFEAVTIHSKPVSFESLKSQDTNNEEGYVIRFESGFRMKIKFEEYVRLHRIMTGFNERTIWEMMKDEVDFNAILVNVPEEFQEWINKVKAKHHANYMEIYYESVKLYQEVDKKASRKDQAMFILKENKELSGLVFNMLDGKEYNPTIWKMIRPKGGDSVSN
jgi:T4 RnlA family RNA ligase